MAGKKMIPAPIDRPLSRAYLREFSGWSTSYPPGLSDSTSLRTMENVIITREGAAAVRPALRSVFPDNIFMDSSWSATMVGSFEPFFLNDGRKAILFAARRTVAGATRVFFMAAVYEDATKKYITWELSQLGFAIPQGDGTLAFDPATTFVRYVQIDNKIFALSDNGEPMRIFNVGATKSAKKIAPVTRPNYDATDRPQISIPGAAWIAGPQVTHPGGSTPTATSLVSSDASKNVYNFAYFYTFSNDIGESAASLPTVIRVQRGWNAWQKDLGADSKSPDQIAVTPGGDAYWNAISQGATHWNLYMLTWTDQAAVPAEGVLLKTTKFIGDVNIDYWATHTPLLQGLEDTAPLPNATNRYNYSAPSSAAQGLVAGDRLVLVNDKNAAGVIRWSSAQQGEYSNFSASKGGGYKTLTSGNLYVPATVKLWQNPQSVDTITILCVGVDGYSTSYYMSPNTVVTGQTSATTIMGFEETTATPGTVSPYGCEVLNNALYHPNDTSLIKSTASNYNISHKTMTDQIQNKWVELRSKDDIISSQFDNKLFFIVNNPDGIDLPAGCKGNEIWVYDTASGETGTWSRWLIPAISLRKMEIGGKLFMSVVRPNGIYILDDLEFQDTENVGGRTTLKPIPWKLETNTQGANRAHDAWAHLQQVNLTLGNFHGTMRYGIRGWDVHGRPIDVSKTFRQLTPTTLAQRMEPTDIEDFLLIRADLREWRMYAESEPGKESYGQISLVQYRYSPVSVNVGYEYGSIETFEYGRAVENWTDRTTDNGVPIPAIDTRRP